MQNKQKREGDKMYEKMSVVELRTLIREKRVELDLGSKGINGRMIADSDKETCLSILNGNNATQPGPIIKPNNNGNGNLGKILARAIQDHIEVNSSLDENRVNELIKNAIDSKLNNVAPTRIETPEGNIKEIGIQHKTFPIILKLVAHRKNIMLVGPAGSGKTTVCEKVSESLDLDFYSMSVGLQTTKSDILGFIHAGGQYVSSLFRQAYEDGGVFCMDEIDAGNSNVLIIINSALSNGFCPFPDGMVKRHKDFVFIGTANTYGLGSDRQYVGRNQLDAATRNRFAMIEFDYDESFEFVLSQDKKWTLHVQSIRKAISDLKEKIICSPRASIEGSALISDGFSYDDLEDMYIFQGINPEIKSRIMNHVRGN